MSTHLPGEEPLRTTMLHLARLIARRDQRELAAAAGVTQQTISRYERGRRTPALDAARLLALELNVPLDLLDRTVELVAMELGEFRGIARPGQIVAIVRIPPPCSSGADSKDDTQDENPRPQLGPLTAAAGRMRPQAAARNINQGRNAG